VRGSMPSALVAQAKKKTGIQSDSKLIEAALANIAVADDYGGVAAFAARDGKPGRRP
jgi:hypothetical protein